MLVELSWVECDSKCLTSVSEINWKSAAFISSSSFLVTSTDIGANSWFSDNCKHLLGLRADKSKISLTVWISLFLASWTNAPTGRPNSLKHHVSGPVYAMGRGIKIKYNKTENEIKPALQEPKKQQETFLKTNKYTARTLLQNTGLSAWLPSSVCMTRKAVFFLGLIISGYANAKVHWFRLSGFSLLAGLNDTD